MSLRCARRSCIDCQRISTKIAYSALRSTSENHHCSISNHYIPSGDAPLTFLIPDGAGIEQDCTEG